jgi:hypothetical protein
MYDAWERCEVSKKVSEKLKGRDHLVDLGKDGL